MERVLFVEIHSLDNERGCFASNAHFAVFLGVSDRQIRTYLASLKQKGFITVTIQNQNERAMHAAGKFARVSDAALRQISNDRLALIRQMSINTSRGAGRKLPHSNTMSNTNKKKRRTFKRKGDRGAFASAPQSAVK